MEGSETERAAGCVWESMGWSFMLWPTTTVHTGDLNRGEGVWVFSFERLAIAFYSGENLMWCVCVCEGWRSASQILALARVAFIDSSTCPYFGGRLLPYASFVVGVYWVLEMRECGKNIPLHPHPPPLPNTGDASRDCPYDGAARRSWPVCACVRVCVHVCAGRKTRSQTFISLTPHILPFPVCCTARFPGRGTGCGKCHLVHRHRINPTAYCSLRHERACAAREEEKVMRVFRSCR